VPTLQFKGKSLVQNHHLVVPFSELEAVKSRGLSKSPSLQDNLIVEGDNLKALKALLPTYHGKVKCIYIDPPYNTGNEGWIYNDRVNSPMMRDWLGRTVDRDDLTRHEKWCCMMLPRLKLLRELLTDDGAIFVSIDDNEVHHLRCLMDEVFGEENFAATVIWQKVFAPKNTAKYFSEDHDFVVVYARRLEGWIPKLLERSEQSIQRYQNPDSDPRDVWSSSDLTARNYYSLGTYEVTSPSGKKFKPSVGNYFRVAPDKFAELDKDKRIWWGPKGDSMPRLKRFLSEVKAGVVPQTLWLHTEVGHTQDAKKELNETVTFKKSEDVFNTPKPTELIKRILKIATDQDSVILDSFAGSGTTAQAVLALNKEDGGNRRFILCQMPYETKDQEKNQENICEKITAERVRRVIKGVPKAKDGNLRDGLGGTFSYFRLGRELEKQAILDGKDLPGYEALAGYVFWTATGEEFQPKKVKRKQWFIGSSREYDVFLLYDEDLEKLKDLALTLEIARALPSSDGKRKLVFAPTRYLDQEFLDQLRINFCQLPYEIYQVAERK
jgi:adenine-specific DNA-methyltransferase